MVKRLVSVLVFAAAVAVPALAADTASVSAFVASCQTDAKSCRSMTLSAVISARNAKYGCIPKDTSDNAASERLYDWLKDTANKDPKYAKDALSDLMWTGIDEVWPCKK